jgi:hypothetical protein
VILLYNAGVPLSPPDDQFVVYYTRQMLMNLDGAQRDFRFLYGGSGPSSTNTESAVSALCQLKDSSPDGILVWQLHQQRSYSTLIFVKRYRTDAQLNLFLHSCHGTVDKSVAALAVPSYAFCVDGANTTVPVLGLLSAAAIGLYRSDMTRPQT